MCTAGCSCSQCEADKTLAAASYATGRAARLKASQGIDLTDSVLIEQLRWHQACPQLPHPGHRLRLGAIAPERTHVARLNAPSELSPAFLQNLRRVLEQVVISKFDDNETRELELWARRWPGGDDVLAALAVVAPLLVSDRLDTFFAAERERVPSAKLALGFSQANSDQVIGEVLRILDGIGLKLDDAERRDIEETLWEQSFASDDPLGRAVRFSADRLVASRVAALKAKAEPLSPSALLRQAAINDHAETFLEEMDVRLGSLEADIKAREQKRKQYVMEREDAAWRRACPWVYVK